MGSEMCIRDSEDRTPQEICIPVRISGELEVQVKHQFTGQGNMQFDGSYLFYCQPEPQGSIVPDFDEPQIGKTGDILWPALETLADQVADPDMDVSEIIQSDFVYQFVDGLVLIEVIAVEGKLERASVVLDSLGLTAPIDNGTNDLIISGCCLLYTSPSPRDLSTSRMPSSA